MDQVALPVSKAGHLQRRAGPGRAEPCRAERSETPRYEIPTQITVPTPRRPAQAGRQTRQTRQPTAGRPAQPTAS